MNFFRNMEYRFGKYAVRNLMKYIVMLYISGIFLSLMNPTYYFEVLSLNPAEILHGQVWRLVTWLVCPPASGIFFNLIAIYLYFSLGTTLERTWGTFRFNVYFFMGVICHIAASFIIYFLTGNIYLLTTYYLNESLFLAFAATFPELTFMLFYILPIKAKWLGVFIGAQFVVEFVMGGLATKIAIGVSMLNFIIFFLMTRNARPINVKQVKRRQEFRTEVKKAEVAKMRPVRHTCAVCGCTEVTKPDMDFRYCSKCAGGREYCMDHLYTHQHVTEDNTKPEE